MKRNLLLACAAFAAMFFGTQSASAYQEPTADGVYYIQNVETGKFIARGNAWGTRAVVDDYGTPFKLVEAGSGAYNITEVDNGVSLGDDYWMYADCSGSRLRAYNLASVDGVDGAYTLHNTNFSSNPDYFVYVYTKDGGDKYCLAGNSIKGDNYDNDGQIQWRFLSQAERDAIIAANVTANEKAVAESAGFTVKTTLADLVGNTDVFAATNVTVPATSAWTFTAVRSGSGTGTGSGLVECFQGTGTFTTSLTGLKKGIYKVTLPAFYRDGANGNCYTREYTDGYKAMSNCYVAANGYTAQIASWASGCKSNSNPNSMSEAAELMNAGKYVNTLFTYVGEDGKLDLTIATPSYIGGGWFITGSATVTYYTDQVSDEDASAMLTTASSLLSQNQNKDVKQALQEAYDTFSAAKTVANYNPLSTAVTNSTASVNAYTNAGNVLPKMKELIDATNVYTEAAVAEYYLNPWVKYTAGTLTTEEANALQDPSVVTGWHASLTCDNFLLSAWDTNPDFNNAAYYINSWSTEGDNDGSNFRVPFFEYWTGDGNSLGEKTLTATMNVKPGKYQVSAWARVRIKNGATDAAKGITFQANDGDAVDACAGAQVGTSQFRLMEVKAFGEVGEDGVLNIKFNVAADNNISWLSFKNVNYDPLENDKMYKVDADVEVTQSGVHKKESFKDQMIEYYTIKDEGYVVIPAAEVTTPKGDVYALGETTIPGISYQEDMSWISNGDNHPTFTFTKNGVEGTATVTEVNGHMLNGYVGVTVSATYSVDGEDGKIDVYYDTKSPLLYAIGDVENEGTLVDWDPSSYVGQLTYNAADDNYTITLDVENSYQGYGWFALSTVLGADSDDWTTFNGSRLAVSDNWGELNTKGSLVHSEDANFKLEAGKYDVTVSLTDMSVVITKSGTAVNGVSAAKAGVANGKYLKNGRVVIVKNGKQYSAAGAQLK